MPARAKAREITTVQAKGRVLLSRRILVLAKMTAKGKGDVVAIQGKTLAQAKVIVPYHSVLKLGNLPASSSSN